MEDVNMQNEGLELQSQVEEPTQGVDFYACSLQELISAMESFCTKELVEVHRKDIEKIRSLYYSKLKSETDAARKLYVAEHGTVDGFVFESHEAEFKEVYGRVKDLRAEIVVAKQKEQAANLKKRYDIIQKIELLTQSPESMNKTFADFRSLQEEWKNVGSVAAAEDKAVWEKYHLEVAKFYDYVKIDRELRDLDLKKNYEAKVALCEKAEALAGANQVVKAFADLQLLHEEWKKIGPVKEELKDALWERFKTATTVVNKAHQDYFENLKKQESENLEKKTTLCEKIENLVSSLDAKTVKQWTAATDEVLELQKQWKSLGYAPQKQNTAIYERFSKSCNEFFALKKSFFSEVRDIENENKAHKIALCEKAESMQTRTDWKEAALEYVQLQKEWKTVGAVAFKDSQKLWNRFQQACNSFYEAKKAFETQKEQTLNGNIAVKEELLVKISEIPAEPKADALKALSALQEEWAKVQVPAQAKADLQKRFAETTRALLQKLQIENASADDLSYKIKINSLLLEKDGKSKVENEVKYLRKRLTSAQSELKALENNIGFFGKSSNASALIASVEKNIEKSKSEISQIENKLAIIKSVVEK
ncbi:MAG: DUF349 domain-containing protein [Bacteroidales bacterium]|nr:DUF349 domain-containing protein [Bacteroidales bacterium]